MHPVPLAVMDYVGPSLGALLFVAVMSLVAEPTRRTLNAIILAGANSVYLSGGFGLWELTYPVIGAAIAFRGLRSYRLIAVGWLVHACWDLAHHLWGNPIWPFMPSSAFGCAVVSRRCTIVPEAAAHRDARGRALTSTVPTSSLAAVSVSMRPVTASTITAARPPKSVQIVDLTVRATRRSSLGAARYHPRGFHRGPRPSCFACRAAS
jgi:hypothetical protein